MKKNNQLPFIVAGVALLLGAILFGLYQIISPDVPINTPDNVKGIVANALPKEYKAKKISSVQRMSEFEEEHRPMHWLVITLKDKNITTTAEQTNIAKPVCYALMQHTDYEGVDIYPTSLFPAGINCSIWGP